jgi:hypothetical protein
MNRRCKAGKWRTYLVWRRRDEDDGNGAMTVQCHLLLFFVHFSFVLSFGLLFFFFFALSYSLCSSFFVFFFLLVFRFSFSVFFFFFVCPSPCVFSVSSSVFSLFFSWPFSVSSSRSLLPVFARSVLPLDSFFSFDFLCQLVLVPLCC